MGYEDAMRRLTRQLIEKHGRPIANAKRRVEEELQ